ncbi:hypothetical protein M917_2653 [Psychrobacter aquaticus CMS 56]|uniref:Uncharacterized protein n=1 Tax=Psychrobacter aquaticus CMS 56 TaxID=1354303 RepID=U4T241_9GAMM|nr:hypothetical protein M917_2653 [Psychrobacter aquaticus CMS 56]
MHQKRADVPLAVFIKHFLIGIFGSAQIRALPLARYVLGRIIHHSQN